MKDLVRRDNLLFTAALCFYIIAGMLTLGLFLLNGSAPSRQASRTQSSLYDIRPELKGMTDTSPDVPPEQAAEENEVLDTEEVHYYVFTATNISNFLNVRKEPDPDAEIIYRMPPGTTGYVLERGESWSLIQTADVIGYSYNDYLDFQEVSEDEYLAW